MVHSGGSPVTRGPLWAASGGGFVSCRPFRQHGDGVMNDFHKAALDRKISEGIVLIILYHLYPARLQGADERGMTFQYFKRSLDAGQLHAIYIRAEQFFLRCQNLEIHA